MGSFASVVLSTSTGERWRRSVPRCRGGAFIAVFFLLKAGSVFGVALSRWSGDVQVRLLLRLIREHQDERRSGSDRLFLAGAQ